MSDSKPPLICFFQRFVDPLIIACSLYVSCAWSGEEPNGHYVILMVLTCFFSSAAYHCIDPYEAWETGSTADFVRDMMVRWFLSIAGLVIVWRTSGVNAELNVPTLAIWIFAAPVGMLLMHYLLYLRYPSFLRLPRRRCAVVVGINANTANVVAQCKKYPNLLIDVQGFFEDRCMQRTPCEAGCQHLGRLQDVISYVRERKVDMIFISHPAYTQPRIVKLSEGLLDTTASVYFMPDLDAFELICPRFDEVAGVPALAVCESPLSGINYVLKRASDLLLSITLLVLFSPLFVATAIAIKATSNGPIIFKQRRYGLNGESITIYKFRSMKVMEDGANIMQAKVGDPRLTSIGAFLRKSSFDELPQLINVLQGRMSLVGPRPHAIAHNEEYRKLIRGYMLRHKIKPGITGWAQIHGLRGETETLGKMEARVFYDLEYIRNWSLWIDLWIILKTVRAVLRHQNAL